MQILPKIIEIENPQAQQILVAGCGLETMPHRICTISEERLTQLLYKTAFSKPVRFFQSDIYGGWVCKKI